MGMETNIINLYEIMTRDPEGLEQGKDWYYEAHDFCKSLAEQSNLSLDTVCKVVSVLSPSSYWERNKQDALRLVLSSNKQEVTVSTYGKNKTKAINIIEGLGDLTYKSRKTYSFYRNILNPSCSEEYVTIDRHAYRAMKGLKTAKAVKTLTPKRYDLAREMYVKTAKKIGGLKPCELQAIVWLSYKKNILNQ